MDMIRKLTRRVRCAIASMLIAVAVSGVAIIARPGSSSRNIEFNPEIWRLARAPSRTEVRSRMTPNLLQRYAFRGWDRLEVVRLLGEPDGESSDVGVPGEIAYFLGPEHGGAFSLDDQYLWFSFQDEKVFEFGIAVN